MNGYRAAIKMDDGKILPVFAGRKTTLFRSQEKAISKVCKMQMGVRGFIWKSGRTLADTPISEVYTIAL